MAKYSITENMLLEDLEDKEGEPFFSPQEIEAFKAEDMFTLADMFSHGRLKEGKLFPMSPNAVNAAKAKDILQKLNLQSNSAIFRIDDLFNSWKEFLDSERKRTVSLASQAAVSTTFTAPVGLIGRSSRDSFSSVASEEILDLVGQDGKNFETDRGAIGLPSSTDDFGYNG